MSGDVAPPGQINAGRLTRLANGAPADLLAALAPALQREALAHGITTPRRVRHWLAQLAHESGGFRRLEESLTYTTAARIVAVWPKRFPTLASAEPFVRSPIALAEKVYGGRMGNDRPGDGWRYRGRGLDMTTGRDNYAAAEAASGLPLLQQPELLAQPATAAALAAAFWARHDLNQPADRDDLEVVTLVINGALTGLAERRAWLMRAAAIWRDGP